MNICSLCGKNFIDYQRKNRTRCGSCNTKIRRFRAKSAAIKYLGGKCELCGWTGNQAAFQFHHKNSLEKDFIIGNVANKSWEIIKKELNKCMLLCANCHSITHSSKNGNKFFEAAMKYKGAKLNI